MTKKTKTTEFSFIKEIISTWKPRAKKIKLKLKLLAKEAEIAPQHLTKIISGRVASPRLSTINKIEAVLSSAELKKLN